METTVAISAHRETWHQTAVLRFVTRPEPVPNTGMVSTVRTIRVLQQMWQHAETGRTQWRDVPLENETTGQE
jgi:hypothetical protein